MREPAGGRVHKRPSHRVAIPIEKAEYMPASETISTSPPRKTQESFLKHYGATVFSQGLLLGLGAVTGILAARVLGPTHRGEFQAVVIWPLAIGSLITLGMPQSIAFYVGRKAYSISETVTAVGVIALVQSVLSILIGLIAVHFALARYSPAVQHLGFIFVLFTPVFILTGYPATLFQGAQDPLRFNIIRTAPTLIYFLGIVIFSAVHRLTIATAAAVQLAGYAVTVVLGLALTLLVFKPRWAWTAGAIPKFLHYGVRTQATSITNYVNQRVDQMILSLFVPPRQLGLYVVAVTLSTAVTVFPQAAGIVTFGRGSAQTREDAIRTMGVSFRASLLWLLVCCTALFLLAPFLIHLVVGHAYDGSILACRILIPGAMMIGLNQVMYNGASALGRPGLPSIAEGVSVGITGLGLYLLVPRYGFIGAAVVSTIAYSISFLTMLVLCRTVLRVGFRDLLGQK